MLEALLSIDIISVGVIVGIAIILVICYSFYYFNLGLSPGHEGWDGMTGSMSVPIFRSYNRAFLLI